MTEHHENHPTAGRRRRHKSPASVHSSSALPVPRLADHLETEVVPSDEEGEKEAKRQKSEPTTPISTCSRHPHEYDEVMGITRLDSRDADGFEQGLEGQFHDPIEESVSGPTETERPAHHESGFRHGGHGSSSLQECLRLLSQASSTPAPCHSGKEKSTNPRHVSIWRRVKEFCLSIVRIWVRVMALV